MLKNTMLRTAIIAVTILTGQALTTWACAADTRAIDVPAGDLALALEKLARQSGVEFVYEVQQLKGLKTKGVHGELTPESAVTKLLEGTALKVTRHPSGAVLISAPAVSSNAPPEEKIRLARIDDPRNPQSAEVEDEQSSKGIPEVLVKGSRILNMDIKRTRDDPLPYVTFDREIIEKSGATNLEDFLKNRLPMNTVSQTAVQQADGTLGNRSSINLRGLGAAQTLILIDGHRTSGVSIDGEVLQSDVNGIPLAAVERIEVLPTTASGIYGGSATGGVVNIILKRDFGGMDAKLRYGNTFDTDVANRRVELTGGFNLESGKTNVLVTAAWSDQNALTWQDRNLYYRGVAEILRNTGGDFTAVQAFGTPLLGATPNIQSANGTNLVLKNGTALNSSYTFVPVGYAGPATDNGAALVANAGKQNLGLADSLQYGAGGKRNLGAVPTVESAMATIQRQFTPRIRTFVELGAARNRTLSEFSSLYNSGFYAPRISATAPNNPFMQTITIAIPIEQGDDSADILNEDRRIVAGVTVNLPGRWLAQADYTWHRSDFSYENDPFIRGLSASTYQLISSGALNVLRDTNVYPVDFAPYLATGSASSSNRSTMKDASLRFAGPVMSLPGGEVMVSSQLAYRDEGFDSYVNEINANFAFVYINPARSQTARSAYLEARIPLVSGRNRRRGVEGLELILSGRYEGLTVNGATSAIFDPMEPVDRMTGKNDSIDPTVAVRWQPVDDLAVRASWGTGFLPPSVFQIVSQPYTFDVDSGQDPRRGDTASVLPPGQRLSDGNPALRPEDSQSLSAGLILTPRWIPGLRLSVDYTHIRKTNNITAFPGTDQERILFFEQYYPERIQRGPKLITDPASWAGPIIFLDDTLLNIALAKVEAYDMQLDYRLETAGAGTFDFFSIATWQTHYQTQTFAGEPVMENVGITSSNPLKFKGNAGVTWNYGNWSAQWVSRYFGAYRIDRDPLSSNAIAQGAPYVRDQIYHDVAITYTPATLGSFLPVLKRPEMTLGVRNLFNKLPPYEYDRYLFYSPYGDAFRASYYLALKTSF